MSSPEPTGLSRNEAERLRGCLQLNLPRNQISGVCTAALLSLPTELLNCFVILDRLVDWAQGIYHARPQCLTDCYVVQLIGRQVI